MNDLNGILKIYKDKKPRSTKGAYLCYIRPFFILLRRNKTGMEQLTPLLHYESMKEILLSRTNIRTKNHENNNI